MRRSRAARTISPRRHAVSDDRTGGFSLIELLVVISVVVVLAALLFPVFGCALESSRRTVCTSNLRQLGAAFRMYEADYDGQLPRAHFHDSARWGGSDPLAAYTRNGQIYYCPDGDPNLGADYLYRVSSLAGLPDDPSPNHPRLVMAPAPSSVIVYCDSHVQAPYAPLASGNYIILRHSGAVKQVPAGAAVIWAYLHGAWSHDWHAVGASIWPVFPDEPWPPTFRK